MSSIFETTRTDSERHRAKDGLHAYAASEAPDRPIMSGAILRKAGCACGGGCPSCQLSAGNLKISQPNDAAEVEADQIADRVMRMPLGKETAPHSHAKVSDDTIHRQPTTPAAEEEPDPIGEGLSTVAENLGENNPRFSELTERLADSFLSQPAPISVGIPAFLGANYAFIWALAIADPAMRRHMNDFNFGTIPGIVPQFPLKTFTYRILNEEQTQFEFDLGLDASGLIEMLNEGAFNTHISTLSAETTGRLNTETQSGGLSSLNVNLGLFDDGLMLSGGFRQGIDPYPLFHRDPHTGEGSRIMQQVPGLPDLYPGQQDIRFMLQVDFVRLYHHFNPSSTPARTVPQEVEGDRVERKSLGGNDASAGTAHPDHLRGAIESGGQPLDSSTRGFFEPRLRYDLSSVRIHTGAAASESAGAVDARAYTLRNHIVFGPGEYNPISESGRHLLAHELAHVTQQNDGNTLHRTLLIDRGASDDPATAVPMMTPLLAALCPDFEINASDFVVPKRGTPCSFPRFRAVATGGHPLGCCCLCTMTRPFGATWRIVVTATDAPTTDQFAHTVNMTPTSGLTAPELRHWTAAGTVSTQPNEEVLGHELCGHAALMKIRAHPRDDDPITGVPFPNTDRSYSDVHDPTVRMQNALATEMGLSSARRGLAASGIHRGESLRVFTIGPFASDADDPAPFSAQIAAALIFMNTRTDLMVDSVGFSDARDTVSGVSASRAARVSAAVAAGLLVPSATIETTPGVDETLTRVQPPIDGGAGPSPVVELRIAVRPAGLSTPIGAAPPATPVPVGEELPGRVASLKRGDINECHDLLATTAWP